jgi:F-type H+-transporting ATPase subunit 8
MPQLLPFFFVNQMSFALLGLFIVIYVISRFILPAFTELFVTRMYITKL